MKLNWTDLRMAPNVFTLSLIQFSLLRKNKNEEKIKKEHKWNESELNWFTYGSERVYLVSNTILFIEKNK